MADWSAEVKKMMMLMRTVFNQEQKEKYLSTVMEQVRTGRGQGETWFGSRCEGGQQALEHVGWLGSEQ